MKIKNIETYNQLKPVYLVYQNTKDKDTFYKAHADKLILLEASKKALGSPIPEDLSASISRLKQDLKNQIKLKEKSYQEY